MMDDVGQTLHDLPASSSCQSNRDFPARGDHNKCCTSLQTRVSSALFQNYRCEDTLNILLYTLNNIVAATSVTATAGASDKMEHRCLDFTAGVMEDSTCTARLSEPLSALEALLVRHHTTINQHAIQSLTCKAFSSNTSISTTLIAQLVHLLQPLQGSF
jgi:hypothetical protein